MPRKPILLVIPIAALLAAAAIFFLSASVLDSSQQNDNISTPISTRLPQVRISPLASTPSLPATPSPALSQTPGVTQSTPGVTPSASPQPTLPAEHYIRNISGHHQYFPLGCETAAAEDWSKYFGHDFNEFEFQYKLPLSDNPDFGFVGNVNSPWGQVPPYAYGVYAGPVADLLNTYGIPAKAVTGYTLDEIRANIAQDKPVITWVIGNVVGGIPSVYTDSKGNKTIVAAYEHVVIVTGYNKGHIRYMTNGKFFETPDSVFLNSWGVLGNMAIIAGE